MFYDFPFDCSKQLVIAIQYIISKDFTESRYDSNPQNCDQKTFRFMTIQTPPTTNVSKSATIFLYTFFSAISLNTFHLRFSRFGSKKNNKKSNLHSTRGITPKRATSGGAIFVA